MESRTELQEATIPAADLGPGQTPLTATLSATLHPTKTNPRDLPSLVCTHGPCLPTTTALLRIAPSRLKDLQLVVRATCLQSPPLAFPGFPPSRARSFRTALASARQKPEAEILSPTKTTITTTAASVRLVKCPLPLQSVLSLGMQAGLRWMFRRVE